MPKLSTKGSRFYPSLPEIGADSASHTNALQQIKTALRTYQREDKNYLKSFIRFEELVALGIIDGDGSSVVSTASGVSLPSGTQGDLLFNAGGLDWEVTGPNFRWKGTHIQLGPDVSIDWDDSVGDGIELLTFGGIEQPTVAEGYVIVLAWHTTNNTDVAITYDGGLTYSYYGFPGLHNQTTASYIDYNPVTSTWAKFGGYLNSHNNVAAKSINDGVSWTYVANQLAPGGPQFDPQGAGCVKELGLWWWTSSLGTWTSPDLDTWTAPTGLPGGSTWSWLAYDPVGGNAAIGGSTRTYYSTDGLASFSVANLSESMACGVWCGEPFNVFVAVASGVTDTSYTSPDGATWTKRLGNMAGNPSPTSDTIAWSPLHERVVYVGRSASPTGDTCQYSDDGGVTWVLSSGPISESFQLKVIWVPSEELFMAHEITSNTSADVWTSPDGDVWTKAPRPSHNAGIYAMGYAETAPAGTETVDEVFVVGDHGYPTKIDGSAITFHDAYTFPTSDGTTGQSLVTDGAGNLSFASVGESSFDDGLYVHIEGFEYILGAKQFNDFLFMNAPVVMLNNNGIQWDASTDTVELLNFVATPETGDPYWANVEVVYHIEAADGTITDFTDEGNAYRVSFFSTASIKTTIGGATADSTSAVHMNGTSDYWDIDYVADSMLLKDRDWCMEMFVNHSAAPDANMCYAARYGGAPDISFSWEHGSGDIINFKYSTTGSNFLTWSSTVAWTPTVDQWYHIAVSRDGPNLRFWIDGVQLGATVDVGTTVIADGNTAPPGGGNLQFGRRSFGTAYMDGYMDNFRLTVGVPRYTTDFAVPTSLHPLVLGDAAGGTFYVGDPAYPTEIDGTLIGLKNNIGINWDNVAADNVELLTLGEGANPEPLTSYHALITRRSLTGTEDSGYSTDGGATWTLVDWTGSREPSGSLNPILTNYTLNEQIWLGVFSFRNGANGVYSADNAVSWSPILPAGTEGVDWPSTGIDTSKSWYFPEIDVVLASTTAANGGSWYTSWAGAKAGTWTKITDAVSTSSTSVWNGAAYSPLLDITVVCLSSAAAVGGVYMYYSEDNCATWTARTSWESPNRGVCDVAWVGAPWNHFVAVPDTTGSDDCWTSTDGKNWVKWASTSGYGIPEQSRDYVVYAPEIDIVINSGSPSSSRIQYSSDGGKTFTSATTQPVPDTSVAAFHIYWDNAQLLFYAVEGHNGYDEIWTSPDGDTWTFLSTPVTGGFGLKGFGVALSADPSSAITDVFFVGDPLYPTQIDGNFTTITGTAIVEGPATLESTLNVDGASDFNSDVDVNGGSLSIWNGEDRVRFTHDGTDFNAAFSGTTDWNITGLTDGFVNIDGGLAVAEKINVGVTTVTTTTHTAAAEHVILVDDDTAAATVTVTLPAAAAGDTVYHIKKLGTTANVVIDGNASEEIDGALTVTLTQQYESVMLVSNGTFWSII